MKRYRTIRYFLGALLPLTLLLWYSPFARAGEPTNLLKQSTDKILETLKDPKLKAKSKTAERRRLLRKIADDRFDWEELAKRSLALHWAERTPEEKREFVSIFSDLLDRSYMGKIEGYKNEKILYVKESIEGDYATVESKVITQREVEVPIDYRLRKKGSDWLIFDVSIEGVSLVNNYRVQFNKILLSSSYPELVKKLKLKQAQEADVPSTSD